MIPNIQVLTEEIIETTRPSRTYKIHVNADSSEVVPESQDTTNSSILGSGVLGKIALGNQTGKTRSTTVVSDRISGYTDGLDAIKQAIYLILNTERYGFIIYSWDYGVELVDLIGKPMPYVKSELPRRIKDALVQDDRIDDVVDFEFEQHGKKLHTTFTVITNIGNISTTLEVDV
jgi:phage baseplate assembly protein W